VAAFDLLIVDREVRANLMLPSNDDYPNCFADRSVMAVATKLMKARSRDMGSISVAASDPQKQEVDPFWNRTVFPDPVEALRFCSPAVNMLFADALFVFDANTLLAPYQVSNQSANEIERIYRDLAKHDRLFMPEQAAREFAKNRGLKLAEMHEEVSTLTSTLPKAEPIYCPMLEGVAEYQRLPPLVESIRASLKTYKTLVASLKQTLSEWGWTDRISELYRELFTADRVLGHDIKDEDMMTELKWRYANQVPPGYKDKSKPDSGIGDYAIWKTILKLGKDRGSSVIFICNEKKHDWVYRSCEQALTPRMELCMEFHRTTAKHFWLVNWPRFLELAGAKEVTVREAKRAERWAISKDYSLMPVVKRVRELLDEIASVVQEGPIDPGSGYSSLQDGELYSLIDSFVDAKRIYATLIQPPTGIEHLNELERVLIDIQSLNRGIEFMEARMKRNADADSEKLKEKCEEFEELYRLFGKATLPLG
jgi:hypothetical protein